MGNKFFKIDENSKPFKDSKKAYVSPYTYNPASSKLFEIKPQHQA